MFSPESLLKLASEKEAEHKSLCAEFPPGTIHDGRNEARREMVVARKCAEWMIANNLSYAANVGPYQTVSVARGQKVCIKKGAMVVSSMPKLARVAKPLLRAQTVTVWRVEKGYVHSDTGAIVQPKVIWSGAGSYWRETDLNNVEIATLAQA